MEAALWARAAVVKGLLRAGATVDLKDRQGQTALDLARDNRRNENERAVRSSMYADDRDKRQQRRIITALLEGAIPHRGRPRGIALADPHVTRFYKWGIPPHSLSIALLQPVFEIPIETIYKTVAFLSRGSPFPVIRAKSGWGGEGAEPEYLSNSHWTKEVMRISKAIGHKLREDVHRDRGVPGRYSACHAEKQLMAFFLTRHHFTTDETRSDEDLAKLAATKPPAKPAVITILVNTEVCDDCKAFRVLSERSTGAQINIQHVETVA